MAEAPVLYCCSFADFSESGDLVPELLSALEYDFSSRRDAETGKIVHTLYFDGKSGADEAASKIISLRDSWKEMGLEIGNVSIGILKKEEWAESWKLHFKVLEVSDRLAIVPTWIDFHAKEGQKIVTLDPGMSFGTGQHATTRFCLAHIDEFANSHDVKSLSLLDAGCGSGILAIAAAKLGFGRVDAFDIDPDATRISKENAEKLNGIDKIGFSTSPLIGFNAGGIRYDVVAANILSSALLAGKDQLVSLVKKGGCLIVSGILDKEYPFVKQAFEQSGCEEFDSTEDDHWRGGAFRRK